jgi:hypothetical protein
MKFDVYGRFFVDVTRESGGWIVYRIDQGRRQRMADLVLADDARPEDIPHALEDLLHEYAAPDRKIRMIE